MNYINPLRVRIPKTTLRKVVLNSDFLSSVKKDGILSPIILREGRQLVDGLRRVMAARQLKLKKIPFVRIADPRLDTLNA